MKIICNAELDVHEISHLRAIAQIDCEGIYCVNCPLNLVRYEHQNECVRDMVSLCLQQNNIDTTYKETNDEQENN